MKYGDRARTRQVFTLTGVEHRGQREGNERLVCFVEGQPGLLAVWGRRGVNMAHIDLLEAAGFPVTIECDWIAPDPYEARNFRHQYWVFETDHLVIVG